jgi:thiol-disulfide isomerase/thioredoxin
MHRHLLSLLLIPSLATSVACSRANTPRQLAIHGTILGADGKPMPMAHARIWRDPFNPAVMVQSDRNGSFRLKTSLKPGVYTLDFSGVGHHSAEVNLWVDRDRDFKIKARLRTHRIVESPKELRLETKNEQGQIGQFPLLPQIDGTWTADVEAPGKELRYRVFGAAWLVEGVPFRFGINGTQGNTFEPTADHNYMSLIPLTNGRAHIVFDPRQLPQGNQPAQMTFDAKDDDLAAAWQVDQDRDAILNLQTLPRTGSAEEKRAAHERITAFRKRHADRWDAALAQETRPRVRQALGAALLLFGGPDKTPVLKAFPSDHPFWTQVGDTELSIAIAYADKASSQALMGLVLDRRDPEMAARLVQMSFRSVRPEQVEKAFTELEALRPKHPVLQKVRTQMKQDQARFAPGQKMPDFRLPSLEDPKVVHTQESFRGRHLLIDFWATWCGPCVSELPGLHKSYEAYKGRGLEVLSLSLDRSPEAIATFRGSQKLPMPWKHAFLEGGMNHPLCQTLQVKGIPRLFLLGPDGTILATEDSLRGEALKHTLEGILGHR